MHIKKVLTRIYVNNIETAISFYENLLNTKTDLRFIYKEKHLELATVGNILIIAGTENDLIKFRDTKFTIIVDSIKKYRNKLLENNSIIIRDITTVPTGKNLTVKHPDGTIVEYVEYIS